MLRGVKVRLYPTAEQEKFIVSQMGACRFVYNKCLAYKKERYESEKLNTSDSELSRYFFHTLKKEFVWLNEYYVDPIKNSINDLNKAYSNFFKQKKGYPKFKSKYDESKIRISHQKLLKKFFDENSSRLNFNKKLKGVKFECSGEYKNLLYNNKSNLRSVTITKKKCCHYYASILIDVPIVKTLNPFVENKTIGIDLGIKSLMTISDGTTVENPKWIRNSEKQLKKLQKQLSKKQKGSKNREKAILKLALKHEKIKNQKQDYLHNITTKLVKENKSIVLEDLNVSGMMKNHSLAKSIQELGLFELKRQLKYKTQWYDRELILVDRFFPSSKTCSCCGWKNNNLNLKDRIFNCDGCGLSIDRDFNASINIKNEGIRLKNMKIAV